MTLSIKSIGGTINEVPKVTDLKVVAYEADSITIEYKIEDIELTICRQYLSLNSAKRIEITKAVGYESETNTFRYSIKDLKPSTSYTIEIIAGDGHDEGTCTLQQSTREAYVYGVRVMENNSNPTTSVTYIEHATGVSPATPTSLGGWADKYPFNKIRMVGFKGGSVTKEINPTNKTSYLDGTSVPSDVDVMIEIPKFYWKTETITNGFELKICKMKLDSSWDCPAHNVNSIEKDNIYIGAYKGYVQGGKLRSRSGVTPNTGGGIGDIRKYAHAVGKGYQASNWYTWKIEQILYLIAYKSLDCQTSLGLGYTQGGASLKTGGTNKKGMIYGSSNGQEQICFLGIEDLWGNVSEIIDGLRVHNDKIEIVENDTDFTNYKGKISNMRIATGSGYIRKVSHDKNGLFLPLNLSGSQTTFYTDHCIRNQHDYGSDNVWIGGNYSSGQVAGIFFFRNFLQTLDEERRRGMRLCYLG